MESLFKVSALWVGATSVGFVGLIWLTVMGTVATKALGAVWKALTHTHTKEDACDFLSPLKRGASRDLDRRRIEEPLTRRHSPCPASGQDIQSGVHVPRKREAAKRTCMLTFRQCFGNTPSAARAILGRAVRVDPDQQSTSFLGILAGIAIGTIGGKLCGTAQPPLQTTPPRGLESRLDSNV